MDPNQISKPAANLTNPTFTPPEAWPSDQNLTSTSPTPDPLFQSQPTNSNPISPQSTTETFPTPTLPATETPSLSKKSNAFLHFFLIGLALILLGILIGVLAARFLPMSTTVKIPTPTVTPTLTLTATQTLDPIANWKTYTSTLDGYQLKYPDNWFIDEDTSNGPLAFSDRDFSEGIVEMYSQGVVMYIRSNIELASLFPAKKGDKISGIEKFPCLKIDQFMLNGLTTVEFSCDPPADWQADYALGKNYVVKHNNKYIEIFFVSNIQENLDNKITDQILSTFKFIETTPPIELKTEVENWSSYVKGLTKLSWDSCDKEPSNSSDLKMTMATVPVSTKEINGVKLAITPKISFTSSDIKEFVVCEAGAYRPIYVSKDYILWISPCSTGMEPDNPLCSDSLSKIEKLYQ